MRHELLNNELLLVVSDPGGLAASEGVSARAVVTATDEDVDRGGLVLAARDPLIHGGARYGFLVALARKQGNLGDALLQRGRADASLDGVLGDVVPTDPFELEWWRGGLGAFATLELVPASSG